MVIGIREQELFRNDPRELSPERTHAGQVLSGVKRPWEHPEFIAAFRPKSKTSGDLTGIQKLNSLAEIRVRGACSTRLSVPPIHVNPDWR